MAALTLDTKTVIDTLLAKGVTAETIDQIVKRLDKIIMPWRPNESYPPEYERRTGTGVLVATVTARLGEFTWAHEPRHHGWGLKVRLPGSSKCVFDILKVEWNAQMAEEDIVKAEWEAMYCAMSVIDEWIREEAPDLLILDEPLPEKS